MTDFETGAHPDTEHQRLRDRADASFDDFASSSAVGQVTLVRPIPWLLNQGRKPSCVGHAFAAGVNSVIASTNGTRTSNTIAPPAGSGPWCSAVSIWRDARFRQTGKYSETLRGTRLQYAVESLCLRGWDDWERGEEHDEGEASQQDDLRDEMFADDKRGGDATRYRIWRRGADRLDQLDAALTDRTLVVVGAFWLRAAFFKIGFLGDDALSADLFGGGDSSHALWIAGRRVVDGRRQYLLVNSWRRWGGIFLPSGGQLGQCAWVEESAIADTLRCHDLMVVRVRA